MSKRKKGKLSKREAYKLIGIDLPVKPRLNRKAFLMETKEQLNEQGLKYSSLQSLQIVSGIVAGLSEVNRAITSEEVGMAKAIKLILEIDKFMKGKESYTMGQLFEVIDPILKL